jgi:hypothetical protein
MKRRTDRRVIMPMASPALAQKYVPPFPRDGAKQVLDNDMISVWYVTWEKGT